MLVLSYLICTHYSFYLLVQLQVMWLWSSLTWLQVIYLITVIILLLYLVTGSLLVLYLVTGNLLVLYLVTGSLLVLYLVTGSLLVILSVQYLLNALKVLPRVAKILTQSLV